MFASARDNVVFYNGTKSGHVPLTYPMSTAVVGKCRELKGFFAMSKSGDKKNIEKAGRTCIFFPVLEYRTIADTGATRQRASWQAHSDGPVRTV